MTGEFAANTRGACVAQALVLALWPCAALAQSYPVKPIRMIVTFPAGSGADIVARTVGQKVAESLGQQVVVDNRAGAGGIVGSELTAKAIADGYTIVMVSSAHTINASMYTRLPYDPAKDFAAITMLASTPYLLVAHPSVPAKNVAELIALAKAGPARSITRRAASAWARTLPASYSRTWRASISSTSRTKARPRRRPTSSAARCSSR
jgi:tripartite-type tricarboxylate transporter receptor subunit TctC